jgi:pentatricopeptide repeat protein
MTYNHSLWGEQDRQAAWEALKHLGATTEDRLAKAPTEREKGYLRAVETLYGEGPKFERDRNYAEAMRRLHESYPDDDEAKAFYSLAILGTAHEGRDHATYMRAAGLAEEVFRDNPRHPGAAHYLIHSYDDPVHAPLGLRAARAYSDIAPAASHAQHMISHIYVALGMWDEVVQANEMAVRVADERRERKGLPVDARNYHALHWLAYGYLQQGRLDDARHLLEEMWENTEESGSRRARYHLAVMRSDYLVNANPSDDGVLQVSVEVTDLDVGAVAAHRFANGWAALARGDRDAAERELTELRARFDVKASTYESTYAPSEQAARVLGLELEALLKREAGDHEAAIERLTEATALEEAMPYEYGPPPVVKPSHELLGATLLELGRNGAARRAFEGALARGPLRTASLLGLARTAERLGDAQTARETYALLSQIWSAADPSLDGVREAQSKAGAE